MRARLRDEGGAMLLRRRSLLVCFALVALGASGAYAAPRSINGAISVVTLEYVTSQGLRVANPSITDAPRCAYLQGGESSQGRIGYMIPLRSSETLGTTRYQLTSLNGVRFVLAFFRALGTCTGGAEATLVRKQNQPGSLVGTVPAGALYALIVPVMRQSYEPDLLPPPLGNCYSLWCPLWGFRGDTWYLDGTPAEFRFDLSRRS